MKIIINTQNRTIEIDREININNDAEFERKHPRQDDGKFGSGGGKTAKPDTSPTSDKYKPLSKQLVETPKIIKQLEKAVQAQRAESEGNNQKPTVGNTIIEADRIISEYTDTLTPAQYDEFDWDDAENALFDKLNEIERERGFTE